MGHYESLQDFLSGAVAKNLVVAIFFSLRLQRGVFFFVVVIVAVSLIFSIFFHFLDQRSDLSVSSFQVRWPLIATAHLAWRNYFSARRAALSNTFGLS